MNQGEVKKFLQEASGSGCRPERRKEIKKVLMGNLTRIPCLNEPYRVLLEHLFKELEFRPEFLAAHWPIVILMCSKSATNIDKIDPCLFD